MFAKRYGVTRLASGRPAIPEVMTQFPSSDTDRAMYLLFDILIVVLGVSMFLYRDRLGRYMARWQQDQARTWPWFYPGKFGRWYTSEKTWRNLFIPAFAVTLLFVGSLWLWKGAY